MPLVLKPRYLQLVVLGIFLTAWQIIGMNLNPIFLSTPVAVAQGFVRAVLNGTMGEALVESMSVYFASVLLAVGGGVFFGLVIGWSRNIRLTLYPYVKALMAAPDLALLPLFIVWFGIHDEAKIMYVATFASLPIIVNTSYGVANVDGVLIEMAKSFGANSRDMMLKVILPAALPMIATGIAYSVSYAIVGVVVAEMWLSARGFGAAILGWGNYLRTDMVLAFVVGLQILSMTLTQVAHLIERRAQRYKL